MPGSLPTDNKRDKTCCGAARQSGKERAEAADASSRRMQACVSRVLSRGVRPSARPEQTGGPASSVKPVATSCPEEFPERALPLPNARLARGATACHHNAAASDAEAPAEADLLVAPLAPDAA